MPLFSSRVTAPARPDGNHEPARSRTSVRVAWFLVVLFIALSAGQAAAVLAFSLDVPHGPLAAGGGTFALLLQSGLAALQYLRPSG